MTQPNTAASGFEMQARASLPDYVSSYFAASAGDGASFDEGIDDWSRVRFRPRVLRDLSTIDLGTTALGTPIGSPIMIAPMAQQRAAHPDAELGMAAAAGRAKTLIGVSTQTVVPFVDLGNSGTPWWYQVYISRARELTELLVGRAVAAGARALMLTVDAGFFSDTHVARHPRDWPGSTGARMTNVTAEEVAAAGPNATDMTPDLTYDDIGWLRELSGLPVLVKGVLRADDAERCVDAGAAGIIVSTHGGRRMGASVTTAQALPEVVEAVGDRVEIYADSGIRTGAHVAAALAMGARGVFVGRPALWALAAGGSAAVSSVLDQLTAELIETMAELGVATLAEFTPDLLGPVR